MYIGYQWGCITLCTQPVLYLQQVLRFFFAGRGYAHQLGAGFYAAYSLRYGGIRIHRVRSGHRLYTDGVAIAQQKVADLHLTGG
jgi:hypothetical protein